MTGSATSAPGDAPLIVTLALDEAAQERFDALRRALFPPGRTQVGAHVTLFHALPGAQLAEIQQALSAAARRTARFLVDAGAPYSLGRGVAFPLRAPALSALHGELRARWEPWLTRQDAQPFRPHVTVQNKVSPAEARATLAELQDTAVPRRIVATGLGLHRYLGGPWQHEATFGFLSVSAA